MSTPSHAFLPVDSREHEIRLLADLVRLSRVTLLYAEEGSGKSAVVRERVMPLLQDATRGRQSEVAVLFDGWSAAPLPALEARIREAVAAVSSAFPVAPDEAGAASLTDILIGLQEALDVTFIIILDRFEDYLAAPVENAGIAEFEEQLIDAVSNKTVRANFLLSLDEDAAPLLHRLQARIAGLGDARVRLPRATVHESSIARAHVAGTGTGERPPVSAAPRFFGSEAPPRAPGRTESLDERFEQMRAEYEARAVPATHEPSNPTAREQAADAIGDYDLTQDRDAPIVERSVPGAHAYDRNVAATAAELSPDGPVHANAPAQKPLPVSKRVWAAVCALLVILAYLLVLWLSNPAEGPAGSEQDTAPPAPDSASSAAGADATSAEGAVAARPDDETVLRSEHDYATQYDSMGYDELGAAAHASNAAATPKRATVASGAGASPGEIANTPAPPAPAYEVVTASPGPLLFIHVRNEAQRARAERLIQPLARRGIRVSGIRVMRFGPTVLDLRYFRPAERNEALTVAAALREVGVPAQRPKRIAGYERHAPQRQYELWLPPG